MKNIFLKRKLFTATLCLLTGLALAGCSLSGGASEDGPEGDSAAEAQEQNETQDAQAGPESAATQEQSAVSAGNNDGYPRGKLIPEQTFDVDLRPLGQVTFASYQPDTSENPSADVVFLIEKDGEVLMQLSGTTEDNTSPKEFCQVEAVSFPDYNNDGFDDIIAIVSYYLGAGPQAATPHSLVRYYSGTAQGGFLYEAQMSENANSALSEITVETAGSFISGGRMDEPLTSSDDGFPETAALEPWQRAYLDYLTSDSQVDEQRGYTLIPMSSDEIPQLVEVGWDEATGCRIVCYVDGKVQVEQLRRLYFTYIPGGDMLCNSEGNMDNYYDLVYRLTDSGLTPVASGYYGAEDNSRVQFDEEGNPIYQYEWDGVSVSQEEYQEALSKVYDFSRAESYDYEELYSVDEVKKAIEEYF